MSKQLKEFYNKEVYSKGKENFHSFPLDDIYTEVYKTFAGEEIGKMVIDLGCGDGEFLNKYMNNASFTLGIDYSEEGINLANIEKKTNIGLFTKHSFDEQLEIAKATYDIATSIGVIEHLDNPEVLFEVANKSLKEGGIFVLEHPNLLNVRGAIWKALEIFFDVEMSLTDKHTILPDYILGLAKKYGFKVQKVKTFRHELGCGEDLIVDYDRRLRKALSYCIEDHEDRVDRFLDFMKLFNSNKLAHKTALSGAEMIWVFKKERK